MLTSINVVCGLSHLILKALLDAQKENLAKGEGRPPADPAPHWPLLFTVSLAWGEAAGPEMKADVCQ